MGEALAHVAAAITGSWGVAHAVPTSQVIAGFEPITVDNRRVMLQEWLVEAVTMGGIAALVIVVTAVGGDTDVTAWVYRHRRCACRRAPACPRRTGTAHRRRAPRTGSHAWRRPSRRWHEEQGSIARKAPDQVLPSARPYCAAVRTPVYPVARRTILHAAPARSVPSAQDADGAQRAGRAGQPSVRSDQFAVQVLGQRDITSVVGADGGSQFEGTRHQSQRRHTLKAELLQVGDGGAETLLGERATQPALAQHRHGLNVDQVGRSESDVSAVLDFDLIKDLADRTSLGEMAQFDRQVLLQRLVAVLGLALQRCVDVVRDVTDQDVRHAYIMLATASRGKEEEEVPAAVRLAERP